MSKEFRFRLWSKSDNAYINPHLLEVWDDSGELYPYKYVKTGTLNPLYTPLDNYIIQQYTGMKDKDGTPICEGDIIEGMFDFGPGGFVKQTLSIEWDNALGYQWGYWDLMTIKIVGNTMENPDLLKK